MIELNTNYSLSQVPYLTNDCLDAYAEELVRDFAPDAINAPCVLDADKFLEYYLRLSVNYRRICLNRKVMGVTTFNEGMVEVVNEDTGEIENLPTNAGTVIIDPSLLIKRNLPRLRFTMLHEGSHWLLHKKAFAEDNPFGPAGKYENQFIAAKEGHIDYSRSRKENTDIERMERQADFLASAILMNRPALRIAFKEVFNMYNEKPRIIIRGASELDDCLAKIMPEYVAKKFGVSKRAALIRLEKLKGIANNNRQMG